MSRRICSVPILVAILLAFVAATAHAMKGDREACFEAGMDGFAPKPIQSAKLLEMLDRLCTGSAPARSETTIKAESEVLDEVALMKLVGGERELAGDPRGHQ